MDIVLLLLGIGLAVYGAHFLVAYVALPKNRTLGRPMGALLIIAYTGYIVSSLMS